MVRVGCAAGSSAFIRTSVVAAWLGISMAACLVIPMLPPDTTVVVHEVQGYRYQSAALTDYRILDLLMEEIRLI